MNISLKIGNLIKFKTLNITDPNTYYGVVKGFFEYDLAKVYFDLDGYYNDVVNSITDIPFPQKENLNYFVMKLETGELVYHAVEWIDENTFELMEKRGKLVLNILDITDTEIDSIVSVLSSNGFVVTVKEFYPEIEY